MGAARNPDEHYTYEDYASWPMDERWEIIHGAPYAMATPTEAHQRTVGEVSRQLSTFLLGKPCRAYIAPFSVRLNADDGDDIVVEPDVLVVCDRSKLADGKGVVGAPDFIMEVLSPSTVKHDTIRKFLLYQSSGVREYWIADPEEKFLVKYILRDGKYMATGHSADDASVPVDTLEGCAIDLTLVFAE